MGPLRPIQPPFPTIAWVATRSRVPPAVLQESDHPSLRNGRYHPSLRNVTHTPNSNSNSNSHPSPTVTVQPDHVNGSNPSPSLRESGPSSISSRTGPSTHPIIEDDIATVNLEKAVGVVPQNEAADKQAQFETSPVKPEVPVLDGDSDAALPRGEKRSRVNDDLTVNDSDANARIAKRKRVE